MLCHGLVTGNIATWYFSIAQQLAQNYRVLMFDMRGHGQSDYADEGYHLLSLNQDLSELVDELASHGEKIHLAGHSYGALLAIQFALTSPERLSTLTVVDAPMPAVKYIYPSLVGLGEQTRFDGFIEDLCRQLGISGKRKMKRLIDRASKLINETSLLDDLAACHEFKTSELNTIKVPTHLIYGRHSPCRAAGDSLLQALPQATLSELDCGHYIPSEAPSLLGESLARYLIQHDQHLVQPVKR